MLYSNMHSEEWWTALIYLALTLIHETFSSIVFYTVHIGFVETHGVIYCNVYFPNSDSEWTFDKGILFLEQNECEDKKQWLK